MNGESTPSVSDGSASFPYTGRPCSMFRLSSTQRLGARFQPMQLESFLKSIEAENSPSSTGKVQPVFTEPKHIRDKCSDSINSDDESTNILDTTILEEDSFCKSTDLTAGITWLEKTPAKNVCDTPMANMFNKLTICGKENEKREIPTEVQPINPFLSRFRTPLNKISRPVIQQSVLSSTKSLINNQNKLQTPAPVKQFEHPDKNVAKDKIIPRITPAHSTVKKMLITPRRDIPPVVNIQASVNRHRNNMHTPQAVLKNTCLNTKKHDTNVKNSCFSTKKHDNTDPKNPCFSTKKHDNTDPKNPCLSTKKHDNTDPKNPCLSTKKHDTDPKNPYLSTKKHDTDTKIYDIDVKNPCLNNKKSDIVLWDQNVNIQSSVDVENQKVCNGNVQCAIAKKPLKKMFSSLMVHGKEYTVINKLGEGGSCQVFRCLEPETLQDRAIKIVNLAVDAPTASGYINEVKMLRNLQGNDRVIKMFDYEQIQQTLFVVMEKGDIDFSVFLRAIATDNQVPTHIIVCYWIEMLKCVKEIHDNGIIHSDLKPSNFLIVGGRLKLIDFGISSSLSSDMTSIIKSVLVGSFNYISPEALLDSKEHSSPDDGKPRIRISYKSDVWSLGCILYEMVYKKTPFHNIEKWAKIVKIIDKNHTIEYPPVNVPVHLIEIIKKCLRYEMSHRPTVQQLLTMYSEGNYF